ncbi:MAG: phage tail tape measure protein, partial [Alphaproteobacteria bacterium]|nr:phage tail tape measure protein [Alphaproteobacteria bacterium]
ALAKLNDAERNTATYNIFGRGAAGTVNALVKGLKVYRKNIEIVSEISNFKGSRDIDYGIVLDTTRSKITMLQNSLSSLWREIGDSMLPIVGMICDSLRELIEPIRTWMKENRKLIGTVTSVLGILAGLRIGMFILGYASTFLFGGLNRLVIVGKALGIGLSVIGIGAKSLLFSFLKFAGITGTIAGGFLGISKGIDGRLVFSFETLISRVNWLAGIGKAKIKTFWESLTNVKIPSFTEKFKVFFNELKNIEASGIIERIKTFDFKVKLPSALFDEIYGKIQNFNIDLKFKLPDFSRITQHLKEKLSQVDFSILSEKIKSMFSKIFDSKNFSLPKYIFGDLNFSELELAGSIAVLAASFFVLPNVIGVAGSALVALVSLIPIAISGFTGLFQASWFLIGTVLPGLGGMLWDISGKLWYLGGKALM